MHFLTKRIFNKLQRYIFALIFISFICGIIIGIVLVTDTNLGTGILSLYRSEKQGALEHTSQLVNKKSNKLLFKPSPVISRTNPYIPRRFSHRKKKSPDLDKMAKGLQDTEENPLQKGHKIQGDLSETPHKVIIDGQGNEEKYPAPNYNVHIFYYPWYGNPQNDNGKWLHWNHEYLPHWDKMEAEKWPHGRHSPPEDIGSNFYPELGAYSSKDPKIMVEHMKQIRSAGIGVLVVSWYPPQQADQQGDSWDHFVPQLMDVAHQFQLKVCLHIEPYKNRTALLFRDHLMYLSTRYNTHPAYYKYMKGDVAMPFYYIYDSYLVKSRDWAKILRPGGPNSVRGTTEDAVFIGLAVERKHPRELFTAGFDGLYTYFASDGFTYGSSTQNWNHLASFAKTNHMLFIPSVGPGYMDIRVRPWNGKNTRDRTDGQYFERSFTAAVGAKTEVISITSFNEWHEGTQIETAVPRSIKGFVYSDYGPKGSDLYLSLARKWCHKFKKYQNQLKS